MALSSATSREPTYTGDGATATYNFSFKVYATSEVQVTKATNASPPVVTTLALTTDYTVTLSSTTLPSAGSITLVAGNLTLNHKLSIRRVLPLTQTTDLVNQGTFFGSTHEQKFDKLVMMSQQLQDIADRSIHLPEQEAGSASIVTLPDSATRASKVLSFDASGNITVSTSVPAGSVTFTATGEALAEAASASAARDVLGATSGQWPTALIIDKNVTAAKLATDALAYVFQARLTAAAVANTPVTVTDITGATTIRVARYGGDKIALYDGSADWKLYSMSADVTLAVPSTTDTMYDIFIYDSSGTLTLDAVAWTNDTTRATALVQQNGVYVKSGATARRYVGSFRTTGVSGNTEDSVTKRYVWNYYNRVPRSLLVTDGTDTWAYTTATFRQARATATNQVEVVIGVSEVNVRARVMARFANSSVGVNAAVGIGIDSTSVNSASLTMGADSLVANEPVITWAEYNGYPGIGQHEIVWLERSEATGATTWQGDNGLTGPMVQSGLIAEYLG